MQALIVVLALAGCVLAAPQIPARQPAAFYPYQRPIQAYTVPYSAPIHHYSHAAPVHYTQPSYVPAQNRPIAILRMAQDVNYDGSYNYGFESENGIAVQSSGMVRNLGSKDEVQVATGSYSYTSPEGLPITTNWYADETGFHADGEHLPKAPISRAYPQI